MRAWLMAALGAALAAGCQSSDPPPLAPGHTDGLSYHGLERGPPHRDGGGKLLSQATPAVLPAPRNGAADKVEESIDLGIALRLAGVDNPTINLARERVRESLANQIAARSLLLPHLVVGGNFRSHSGSTQDAEGFIQRVSLQSFYLGSGAVAVGSNPAVIPGVRLFAHLGDAVYEPLAARQRVAAQTSEAAAVQNQILRDVAVAYFELIAAEAQLDILKKSAAEVSDIAKVAADFAKAGQGAQPDANRAAANRDLVERQREQAEGRLAASSARLARLLNLDPTARLRTPGGPLEWVRLIDEDVEVESLLAAAAANRPELQVQSAVIQVAQTRLRQEKVRPFVPVISAGFSAGAMGGGTGSDDFTSLKGRSDFDVFAVWNIQNLGLGNHARVRVADATFGQAIASYDAAVNRIRREVATAQADARAACRQMTYARDSLLAAEEGYKLERERVRQGQGRPIEALDSFRQVLEARLELLRSLTAFNIAQFRLFTALGNTPGTK